MKLIKMRWAIKPTILILWRNYMNAWDKMPAEEFIIDSIFFDEYTITEAYGEAFKPEKRLPKKILRSMRNKAKKAAKDPLQLEIQFPPEQLNLDFNA